MTRGGDCGGGAAMPGDDRAQITHADLDDIVSNGNRFKLIIGQADMHLTVEDRNRRRYGAATADGFLDAARDGHIRGSRQTVANDGRFQRNNRAMGCDGFDNLRMDGSGVGGHEGTLLGLAWQDGSMTNAAVVELLMGDIARTGYYPELVSDALDTALAGEVVQSYLVHHEATFDRDQLRRHMTVLALTATRLIVQHTDEHPSDEANPTPYASASTEAVRLEKVDSVVVTRVVGEPAAHTPGGPAAEVVITIGWGAVNRIDLEPATCGDPQCEADHGFTGTSSNDDFSVRVSSVADGPDVVSQALAFAAALSQATATSLH